jgi:hypothetical protein
MRRTSMLVWIVIGVMSPVLVGQMLEAATVGTYSEGIRVGVLYKCSLKVKKLGVQRSAECALQLGKASSGGTIFRDGEEVQINPWAFSADDQHLDQLMSYVGKAVYVRYQQVRAKVMSAYWTDYVMQEIGPLDASLPRQQAFGDETMRADFAIRRSSGIRVGRIVKASNKGGLAKTMFGLTSNEVIIQLGGEGSHFMAMSIIDADLFAYALEWAKSGKLAKIQYDDNAASLFSTRETQYVIWRISQSEPLGWPDDNRAR